MYASNVFPRFALAVTAAAALLYCAPPPAAGQAEKLDQGTVYPRLLRIEHSASGSNGSVFASTTGHIFRSDDEGKTFHLVSEVEPAAGLKERCCATLFEVPRDVGALKAGTLLYSTSDLAGTVPSIEVYASMDEGVSWKLHSTVKRAGSEHHGLWEPEFSIAADGALVVFWSDETDPCCSQKLMQKRSYDGRTWIDERDTVGTTVQTDRPGMILVKRLPSGLYFMTYEVCGHFKCGVFSRTSRDGWDFGDPHDLKQLVRTRDGEYFEHAPQPLWIPDNGGTLLVIGQVLYTSDGTVDTPHNGHTLFRSSSADGEGPWEAVQSPINIPRAYDNYCPNYSSALLSTGKGSSLLEIASDYDAAHHCVTYYATAPWDSLEPVHPAKEH